MISFIGINKMLKKLSIKKKNDSFDGVFHLPYSKSESNRALIIKALNDQKVTIHNMSEAEDTLHLNKCLRLINTCGVSGLPMVIDVKNTGTSMRFLTAYLSILKGKWLLTGCQRMQERPILFLVNALKQLGADISYTEKPGFPPILINGNELQGGTVSIDASISSQFITALLLIGSTLSRGLKLQLKGEFISRPYVMMTILMLREFGIDVQYTDDEIIIPFQEFSKDFFEISPDWSAASYAYELVALSESGSLFIPEIKRQSLQGDNILPDIYADLGVASEFTPEGLKLSKTNKVVDFLDYDFMNCPDLAQAVIATCVGLGIEGRFKGLQSLRIKETDRIEKMDIEFSAFGYNLIEVDGECLLKKISDKVDYKKVDRLFQTYGDHRMAMSLAPLVLKTTKLKIENPDVVIKSFPAYWKELKNLGFVLKES